ncbi:spermidine/putrescine ABC transporter ATP-binding protein [Marivita lacus]|uniref:Spermidine/putrescine ABC transporter ATP-binding protein n=1 Tax=Marivita lacus TaxID=1323742 RepID=A0ABQ1KB95_9RHOB|nr:ABC transporter ATP-binding protein [Marivita lacus]GGB93534.1 spermidine/putrescine ABC transporter ATP-binding protein [Marivita lacus]
MSITLTDLRKSFSGKPAVNGIDIDIAPGEFFAIVGASGCGKSTLLRLIAGLEVADAGEIALGGKQVSGPGLHLPSEARGVGFVFQSYALWPHLDVRGNVAFPLEAAGLRAVEAARRAERHLTTVALEHYASRKPAELSGGQRQRVALARCLAQDAGIILMDEPLANLDPHLRATMEEELVAFHRAAAATTVYITHDQREAMAVADRMAVMAAGRFLQVGAPDEVYARPASAEVARFIGEGVVHPVTVTDGVVSLAGQPVPVQGEGGADGPRLALFRPKDLVVTAHGEGGALTGRVTAVLYRGGYWEAKLAVDGLTEPFLLHLPRRAQVGDELALCVSDGWLLPE